MRTLALMLLAAAAGCVARGGFECAADGECGTNGRCEFDDRCSFPDTACESGRRYGFYAGDRSGQCVPADTPDAHDPDPDGPLSDGALPPDAPPPDMNLEVPGDIEATHRVDTLDLDGSFDDWTGARWYQLDAKTAGHMDYRSPLYDPSVSVRFAVMYDTDHLFFAFDVTDSMLVEDSSAWEDDDSARMFLDLGLDAPGPYGIDDFTYTAQSSGSCQLSGGDGSAIASCGSMILAGGYHSELRITFSGSFKPAADDIYGFTAGVDDDDGQPNITEPDDRPDAWVSNYQADSTCPGCCIVPWSGHPEPWCDTTTLGRLLLLP